MKNKIVLVIILLIIGCFCWSQIRLENIKKSCYKTTKIPRENEKNLSWSNGKEWGLGEIGNSPRKPEYTWTQKFDWGWVYPDRNLGSGLYNLNDIERENHLYNSCLKDNGIF